MKNGEKIYHSVYIKNVMQVMKFLHVRLGKREKPQSTWERERRQVFNRFIFKKLADFNKNYNIIILLC